VVKYYQGYEAGKGTENFNLDVTCIVLAGGRGLRLGRNKALEIIDNTSSLERVISVLGKLNGDIIIVTSAEQLLSLSSDYPHLKTVTDIYPGKSSLGGIYTGLVTSDSLYNLVVACDMPFLNQALLDYMIQISDDFDLVIPRVGKMVEPLHAIYSKNCLAPMEELLKQDNLKISQLLDLIRVRYVEAEEINRFDAQHLSFFNINTKEDLRMAREFAKGDRDSAKC